MAPLVSVCVPTYNYGRFLPNCIRSVLAQSEPGWELVICDDLSNDETAAICEKFSQRDPRIRYFRNEQRLGVYGNLAAAVARSRAEFVKVVCSDDWLHPLCLERCLALAASHPTAALICTNCIDTDEVYQPLWSNYVLSKEFMTGREVLWREILGDRCVGGNSSFFFRREAYRAAGGYDAGLRYVGDYLLALKLCLVGDFAHTNEALFFGRRHGQQSSVLDPKTLVDVIESWRVPEILREFATSRPGTGRLKAEVAAALARARLLAYYWVIVCYHQVAGHGERARMLARNLPRSAFLVMSAIPLLPLVMIQAGAHQALLRLRQRTRKITVVHFDGQAGQ